MTNRRTPKASFAGLRLDAVIRVSRRNGRSGDSFMSPAEQHDAITHFASAQGVKIVSWHDETNSVSGGSVERAGLQAALDRVLSGETDGIIVAKLDRFARSVTGGLRVIYELEDAGKYLISVREGVICGAEPADATSKLIRTFFLALAEWQRDTLSEGWESARERHIAAGV